MHAVGGAKSEVTINNFAFNDSRVNYNTSLVGWVPLTQPLVDYCAEPGRISSLT